MVFSGRHNWLYEFRLCLGLPGDALEFAKLAASYNPHGQRCRGKSNLNGAYTTQIGDASPSINSDPGFSCSGVAIGTVVDVYKCGSSAFVKSRDVQLDLAKVYLLLCKAKHLSDNRGDSYSGKERTDDASYRKTGSTPAGRRGDEPSVGSSNEVHEEVPELIDKLAKKFKRYVVICVALSEQSPFESTCQRALDDESLVVDIQHQRAPRNAATHFKIDPTNYRGLIDYADTVTEVVIPDYDVNAITILSWPFYRDATCGDVFHLLCYSLMIGNFEAFNVILQNHEFCMLNHLRENWKVLLSYIPVACDYVKCRQLIEKIFDVSHNPCENGLVNGIDWILWRAYVILETTHCSFYLAYKFLMIMSPLFLKVKTTDPYVASKQHLVENFLALMKQHIIYCSLNTSAATSVQELQTSRQISFIAYLKLKPSEKLELFCECNKMPNVGYADCMCEDIYKDKYGIYKSCLKCKTANRTNTLSIFFQLIKSSVEDIQLDNPFAELSQGFRSFFARIKQCASATLNDYMEDIYHNLDVAVGSHMLETLYVLTKAMLTTELRNSVHTIVFRILYNRNFRYNIITNYFVYKSICVLLGVGNDIVSDSDDCLREEESDWITSLSDTHLAGLCGHANKEATKLEYGNPHYQAFLKLWKNANGRLTRTLVIRAVICEINFVEALLNLVSLMRLSTSDGRTIYVDTEEITRALYDKDSALLLMQRILLYLLDHQLSVGDFRSCLYALNDMSTYINGVTPQELNTMFLYTICTSSKNLSYLDAQCHVWFTSCSKSIDDIGDFLRSSLRAAKLTVYRLSKQRGVGITLARVITDLLHTLHVGACDYLYFNNPLSKSGMEIHEMLGVYLNYMGVDWDGCIMNRGINVLSLLGEGGHADYIPDYDAILADIRYLGVFQRFSTVLMGFSCDIGRYRMKSKKLGYRFYLDRAMLAENGLGSLASIFFKKSEASVTSSEIYWASLLFASILSGALTDGDINNHGTADVVKRIRHIKASAVLVLPKEWREDVAEVLEALARVLHDAQNHGDVQLTVADEKELSIILGRLWGPSWVKSADFVGLGRICSDSIKSEMPEFMSFVKEEVFNIADASVGTAKSHNAFDTSAITLFEVLTGPDCDSEMTARKGAEVEIDNLTMRKCILRLLSTVNLTKVEVYQADKMKISFDKLAHRFTGNTASGLLSKALGKAETGLSSIALKKMQFETLKGKFFTSSKKNTDNFNGCFLPILNFYSTAVICITDYDFSDELHPEKSKPERREFTKWPSASRIDVLQLIRVDIQLGVIKLLETCNFTLNTLFVEQLHQIFHSFNVHQCLRVLAVLRPLLQQFGWSQSLMAHLETIEKFLNQFCSFPSDTEIYIGRFIASSKYRMELFEEISAYVLDNLNAFLHIYRCLDALFSCKQFGPVYPHIAREAFELGELVGAVWTNEPIAGQRFGIDDHLLMNEYIRVLMRSFEKTFWESNPAEIMEKVRCVEPDFLQLGEQYRDSLISMYDAYLQKRMHKPGHWLSWRKLVCRFLSIYPDQESAFGELFRPNSEDVIQLLEVVERTTDGFDITEVDRFESFKRRLMRKVNVRNYFEIASAMRYVDLEAAKALVMSVHSSLHLPDNSPGFDATGALYDFDVESVDQW
ncbi:uncharacterized protein BXIN_0849 [Babesia sp. Xinjiang]|uniref:uncharacterized protein n=1 Tax=Babesia sp. Xinjiang TaxID=462227 RepID=UPI000A256DDB|nr:uncharacterized protein BXIN_0849 [Babesia sp. Xinjiang]ORM41258.1 hypothetical protein BXIN_0849 [Babesia sp. Xinjiang]